MPGREADLSEGSQGHRTHGARSRERDSRTARAGRSQSRRPRRSRAVRRSRGPTGSRSAFVRKSQVLGGSFEATSAVTSATPSGASARVERDGPAERWGFTQPGPERVDGLAVGEELAEPFGERAQGKRPLGEEAAPRCGGALDHPQKRQGDVGLSEPSCSPVGFPRESPISTRRRRHWRASLSIAAPARMTLFQSFVPPSPLMRRAPDSADLNCGLELLSGHPADPVGHVLAVEPPSPVPTDPGRRQDLPGEAGLHRKRNDPRLSGQEPTKPSQLARAI